MHDVRVLTIRQPWADLVMSGLKDVENRSWPVPSTLPQWFRCQACGANEVRERGTNADHDCSPAGTWWRTGPFPFRLGIHAAAKPVRPEDAPSAWVDWAGRTEQTDPATAPLGALLGTVEVTGCHHADECVEIENDDPTGGYWTLCSRWAEDDAYHWTLTDPQPYDVPVAMKGRLGLWTAQLEGADRG